MKTAIRWGVTAIAVWFIATLFIGPFLGRNGPPPQPTAPSGTMGTPKPVKTIVIRP